MGVRPSESGVSWLGVLSTTSLILQRWLAIGDLEERKNPYVLYSASNLGSIGGLLAYPILVEPLLTLRAQQRHHQQTAAVELAHVGLVIVRRLDRHGLVEHPRVMRRG